MSSSPSCSCSPPHHAHVHTPALDLLDEYWFFSNTLAKSRTPWLPSAPHVVVGNQQQEQQDEVVEVKDDDDLNWSSIYEGVLRTSRMMAETTRTPSPLLRRAPSMPVPSPAHQTTTCRTPSSAGGEQHQQRRRRQDLNLNLNLNLTRRQLSRSKSVLNKWRSSSDLESSEVQGFRDLGFVFNKEEQRESLAAVLPGLKHHAAGGDSSSRPYLPAAALVRVQSSDASEMKDQLRMWAHAVAKTVS